MTIHQQCLSFVLVLISWQLSLRLGSQILPTDRLSHDNFDDKSKQRLIELIKKSGKPAILFSGDVHLAEVLEDPCASAGNDNFNPIYALFRNWV